MDHFLRREVLGTTAAISISKARFDEIVIAHKCIGSALAIEENYNGLFDLFVHLHKEIVGIVVEMTLQHTGSWSEFIEYVQRANRVVIPLLNGGAQYVDQAGHALSSIKKLAAFSTFDIDAWHKTERSNSFEYGAVDFIRDLAQHQDLPSQAFSVGGRWIEEGEVRVRRHSCSLGVKPAELKSTRRHQIAMIQKMNDRGERLDLLDLVRKYLGRIASAHKTIRDSLTPHNNVWEATIAGGIAEFGAKYEEVVGLQALATDGTNVVGSVPVFPGPMERRRELARRNPALISTFEFEVISGEDGKR